MITPEQLPTLLPLVHDWASEQEAAILGTGVPLTSSQIADAQKIGIAHPEKVRLLRVPRIPVPQHPMLRAAVEATGLISADTAGLSLRYGIFIHTGGWDDRCLVFHELVHTLQYERLGGLQPFLQQYLYECLTVGYHQSPLEQEAVSTTEALCV